MFCQNRSQIWYGYATVKRSFPTHAFFSSLGLQFCTSMLQETSVPWGNQRLTPSHYQLSHFLTCFEQDLKLGAVAVVKVKVQCGTWQLRYGGSPPLHVWKGEKDMFSEWNYAYCVRINVRIAITHFRKASSISSFSVLISLMVSCSRNSCSSMWACSSLSTCNRHGALNTWLYFW